MLAELQRDLRAAMLTDGNAETDARMAIHRNNVRTGLTDTLATAFPVVRRIVGPAFFTRLAYGFIAAAPPRVPQLCAYGDGFADFIAASPDNPLPYLADVARLEWARAESYFAADAPRLDADDMRRLGDDVENARLEIHPATRLVRAAFPIMTIWRVNQPEARDVPEVNMDQSESALVTRPDMAVAMRLISDADAALIAALATGETLRAAAAAAFARDPEFDLQAALAEHLRHATFRD